MNKKIIFLSLIVVFMLILLPAIPAVQIHTTQEVNKSHFVKEIDDLNIMGTEDSTISINIEKLIKKILNIDQEEIISFNDDQITNKLDDLSNEGQYQPLFFFLTIYLIILKIIYRLIKPVIDLISSAIEKMIGSIVNLIELIFRIIKSVLNLVSSAIKNVIGFVVISLVNIIELIGKITYLLIQMISKIIKASGKILGFLFNISVNTVKFIFQLLINILDTIIKFVGRILNFIVNSIINMIENVKQLVNKILTAIKNILICLISEIFPDSSLT